jgi:hypothetical protein
MNKADAYLRQARSDFRLFEYLWGPSDASFPPCHALQHLQMATEKLSKSALQTLGRDVKPKSHAAFREMFQILRRPDVARRLGYTENAEDFRRFIARRQDWFKQIEQLSPSIGTDIAPTDGENVEYPWESRNNAGDLIWNVPAEFQFDVASELRSRDGQQFVRLIRTLLDRLPEAIT